MSISELDKYNPMEEDYKSPIFNSYNGGGQSQADKDPCGLYVRNVPAYFSEDAFRSKFCDYGTIVSLKLIKKLGMNFTCGLVRYETAAEATLARQEENGKPPLNLIITNSNNNSHNATSRDVNMNLARRDQHASASSRTICRGRGQPAQAELIPLQVQVDGNKRVAFQIPELIPNPYFLCLACKKPGGYSCKNCIEPYCSPACQKDDWTSHKSICKPFTDRRENGLPQHQNKCEAVSSMSEGSDEAERKKTHLPSRSPSSAPQPQLTRQKSFHRRSPQNSGSSRPEPARQLTLIKSNEIEDSSLPLNRDEEVYVCNFKSPAKFWVHLKEARFVLSEMEKRLNEINKSVVTCAVNDVCCTLQEGAFRRIKVVEIKENGVIAEIIDYGGNRFVKNNLIYHLPPTFKKYFAQAICCKLVDATGKVNTIHWKEEDFAKFQYTTDKIFTAKAYRCYNNEYEVKLKNDKGASLYLTCLSYIELKDTSGNALNQVPSVWSNLKEGTEVEIKPFHCDKDKFWTPMMSADMSQEMSKTLEGLATALKNVETEVINMRCKEGDIAIGYSKDFKEYFRCVLLEKLQGSFKVLYIDYGNTEVITELRSATQAHLKEKSFVVCCTKPDSMSSEEFQKVFQQDKTERLHVKSVKKSVVELSFTNGSHSLIVPCFPWNHGISSRHSQTPASTSQENGHSFKSNASNSRPANSEVRSTEKKFYKPGKPAASAAQSPVNKAGGNIPITWKSISDKNLAVGEKYNVNIVLIKPTGSEMYVQLMEDKERLSSFSLKINEHCTSETSPKYSPVKDEIVCCKFSEDGSWYRAQVLEKAGENKFKVLFIDYGNEDVVSDADMKPLPPKFICMKFAACVLLFNEVRNEDMAHILPKLLGEPWVMEVKEASKCVKVMFYQDQKSLLELINVKTNFCKSSLNTTLEGPENVSLSSFEKSILKNGVNEVMFCHSEDGVYYCQLKEDGVKLSAMSEKLQIADLKPMNKTPQAAEVVCAKSSDSFWYRGSLENIQNSNYKVFFIDFGNTEVVAAENVKFLPVEFNKYPIFSIPVRITNITKAKIDFRSFFSLKAGDFASDGFQNVEIVLSKNMTLPNISALTNRSLPKDKEVEVIFCFIENDVYYAHVIKAQELINSLEKELKNAATFGDLLEAPTEGDVICAKFIDGAWYRGTVRNVCDDQKRYQVFFIDYGNSAAIELNDLKMLPTELCEIPILAVPMKVANSEELVKQGPTNVVKIKVVEMSSDNLPIVEIVSPENDIGPSSIETQVLSDSVTEVVLTYKEGTIFYVQKKSDVERLGEMMINIQGEASSMKTVVSPKVGQFVCVKFVDGIWYRCLITENSGNKVKALFVDYGNTDEVTEIFRLPAKYFSYPMFSIPVIISNEESMASLLIIDSIFKVKYSGKMTNDVQVVRVCPSADCLLLPSIKKSSLEIGSSDVYFHRVDGLFYFVTKATDMAKLNEMKSMLASFTANEIYHVPCVKEFLLVRCDQMWHRGCVTRVDETKKVCEVLLVDLGSTKTIPFSDMSYIPKSLSSFPLFLSKVSLSPDDPLSTPISFGKRYTVIVVETSTDVPIIKVHQPVMLTSLERKSLPLNEVRTAFFFHKENDVMFLQDINDAAVFKEIHSVAQECASSKVISHNPIAGELLCAQSDADGEWYRCCIEEIVEADRYKIHYIDYGNSEVVSKKNLRYLSSSLAKDPSFGIAVKIIGQPTVELVKPYNVIAVSEPVNNIQDVKLLLDEEEASNVPAHEVVSKDEPIPLFQYSALKSISLESGEQCVIIHTVLEGNNMLVLYCAPFNIKNIEANHALTNEITKYCTSLDCFSYNGDSLPVTQEMVLALSPSDQKWHRAMVADSDEHPFYDVSFVDHGEYTRLHEGYLRKMEKRFMTLPVQSVMCNLKGFKFTCEDTIIEEINKLIPFGKPEPQRAIVTLVPGDDPDIEIPAITNYLVEKGLAAVDRS